MRNRMRLSIVVLGLLLVLFTLFGFTSTLASPRVAVNESFKNSTAPGWSLIGNACLTAGGSNACPDAPTSEGDGNGWLRLTSAEPAPSGQAGSAIYNTAFPSTDGVQITFQYAAYGGTTIPADGFAFYLIDGATATPTVGWPGGALGYSREVGYNHPGVTNGYVGIGFDEYGNFARWFYGPCATPCPSSLTPDTVNIRGSGSLNTGFNYLTQASATIPTGSRSGARTARITIAPGATKLIKVEIDSGSGFGTVIDNYNLSTALGQIALPPTLKMGFSGSTGVYRNYHEIRNVTQSGAQSSTTTLSSSVNPSLVEQPVTFTATVSGGSGAPTGTVNFKDGAKSISGCASVSLNGSSQATCTTSALGAGFHTITAVYGGDATYGSSTGTLTTSQIVNNPAANSGRNTWVLDNSSGFGNLNNIYVASLAPFGGQLYAGTYYSGTLGAQVWRQSTNGSWSSVTTDGFGDARNSGIDSLLEYKGQLYASTEVDGGSGGQVWRSATGNAGDWNRVVEQGFGDSTNGEVFRLQVYSNTLYASTWSYTAAHGSEIWRTSTGNTGDWTRVMSNGFGNSGNAIVLSFESFNGYLYAGSRNSSLGGQVWRCQVCDGSDWSKVNTNGFGTANNTAISALSAFNGYLYASTTGKAGFGDQVWRCQTCNGSDWTQVVDNGFGDAATNANSALEPFAGYLYLALGNTTTGLQIWRCQSCNGADWQQVVFYGFGHPNGATYFDNSLVVSGGHLFAGTMTRGTGGEIWTWPPNLYLPLVVR